jgi:four helix bundle protein
VNSGKMSDIKSYKDLLIWQKGIQIVVLTYKITKSFPKDEIYALTSQIKRASVSVPSNIAEGYGRNTDKSFSHFIDISRGSLFELETQMIIAKELDFVNDLELFNKLMFSIQEESKMINAFSKSLNGANH